MRAFVSDETLLGYALFVAMATVAVFAVLGLGAFAYNEAHEQTGRNAGSALALPALRLAGAKEEPAPTTICLFADGALLVNTEAVRPEKAAMVFEEIHRTAPALPLFIRCKSNVPQGILLDALTKARAAGLGDVRLEIEGMK